MPPRQTSLSGFFETGSSQGASATKKPGASRSNAIELTSDDDEPPKKRAKLHAATASSSGPSAPFALPGSKSALTHSPYFPPPGSATSSSKPVARAPTLPLNKETSLSGPAAAKPRTSKPRNSSKTKITDNPALKFARKPAVASGHTTATSSTRDDELQDDGESDGDGVALNVDELNSGKFKSFAHASTSKGKGGKTSDVGPSGLPYTPLEKQVIGFQVQYPGVLLLFEVGYKYRFYGEDARIAAQALGFVCYRMRNFLSASFPIQSRPQHVKKLLSLGHKVGIIGQAETAALKKASSNRNSLFERKLLHLWTSATYIDELDSADNSDDMHHGSAPSILCIVEHRKSPSNDTVVIGLVSVTPSTGDIIYDEFEDSYVRTELETRIAYIRPWELLLPSKGLSTLTESMLKLVNTHSMRSQTREERFKECMDYSDAFDLLDRASAKLNAESVTGSDMQHPLVVSIVDLPRQIVVAVAHVYQYLEQYRLEKTVLEFKSFKRFADRVHMLLNASTLSNLEIFRNQTTFSKEGSLWSLLDRTESSFGSRLLKEWIGRPLTDKGRLQERLDAIEEIRTPSENGELIDTLRNNILKRFSGAERFPDLAKGLSKIQYGRCTPQELGRILSAFRRIANTFKSFDPEFGPGMRSKLLNDILASLPSIQDLIEKHTEYFDFDAAAKGKRDSLWRTGIYPKVEERIFLIAAVQSDFDDELRNIRKTLRRPALQYKEVTSSLSDEFVIELEKSALKDVPDDWELISKTSKYSRYRSPRAKTLLNQLEQHREQLQIDADEAFLDFQSKIAQDYAALRRIVTQIAVADCLVALAHVSMLESYCRPTFVDTNTLEIVDGRHPTLDLLRGDPYIPNSLELGTGYPNAKIITGPNMGGKSSFVRMVGLIVVMAQVGAYVPAKSVTLGLHDALLARMGASDELMKGRSTFMVEMAETKEIIETASSNSLVILDELGRGTSTFDGMAIASAVLEHLVSTIHCKVLFITHYPHVATTLAEKFPFDVSVAHMGFIEEESSFSEIKTIHFLYKLRNGLASSFGVECGRLAGLPESLLETAAVRSAILQEQVHLRVKINKWRKASAEFVRLQSSIQPNLDALRSVLRL